MGCVCIRDALGDLVIRDVTRAEMTESPSARTVMLVEPRGVVGYYKVYNCRVLFAETADDLWELVNEERTP